MSGLLLLVVAGAACAGSEEPVAAPYDAPEEAIGADESPRTVDVGPAKLVLVEVDRAPGAAAPAPSRHLELTDVDDAERIKVVSDVDIPPEALQKMEAYDIKQATAEARICVAEDGRVLDVELVEDSGIAELDAAMVQTLSSWTYEPRFEAGNPVLFCERVNFHFRVPQADDPSPAL